MAAPENKKRLTTAAEATTATSQHTTPCHDCPWRRNAIAGWLGGDTAVEWLDTARGDGTVECHTVRHMQCAGIAIFRANICKLPRDRTVLRLPQDFETVFETAAQFEDHHARTGESA